VNALANPEVGSYVNKHFVSAFQKVATFRIVNGQKQGGNVASYFCAPDGRVLHCIPGPVDAGTFLREAHWVVDAVRSTGEESRRTEQPWKAIFRRKHSERLRQEHGLVVEPVLYDPPAPDGDGALTYRDPSGRPIVPVLPPPPIDGPDVRFEARAKAAAAEAPAVADKCGRRWRLDNVGRVHQIFAAHALVKLDRVYATIFEQILGERVSTQPVITVGAAPGCRTAVCLGCGG
jgi:hypothetical protein